MYIYRNIPFEVIWRFGWKNILLFIVYGALLCVVHHQFLKHGIHVHIPFSLLGPIGIAVSIYAGFKNSQSYDRTWEARKNWGALAGLSKQFANQLNIYIHPKNEEEIKILLDRQIAFMYAHKLQLRKRSAHSKVFAKSIRKYYAGEPGEEQWKKEVGNRISASEYDQLTVKNNKALQILYEQSMHLQRLHLQNQLDTFQWMEMVNVLNACIENIGKNERIKSTPFPRQYAFFSKTFVIIFILILPFGILDLYPNHSMVGYVVVTLLYSLVAWLYITMELISDHSEDPFENFITDIPMTTIIANTERDLYDLFQFTPLPQAAKPLHGVSM